MPPRLSRTLQISRLLGGVFGALPPQTSPEKMAAANAISTASVLRYSGQVLLPVSFSLTAILSPIFALVLNLRDLLASGKLEEGEAGAEARRRTGRGAQVRRPSFYQGYRLRPEVQERPPGRRREARRCRRSHPRSPRYANFSLFTSLKRSIDEIGNQYTFFSVLRCSRFFSRHLPVISLEFVSPFRDLDVDFIGCVVDFSVLDSVKSL